MVGNNNMIPLAHFHKKWQSRVKTWFDQPMQKLRRKNLRDKKLRQAAPKPLKSLRPVVHCPSVRYNIRTRTGRGFTLQELKRAGINKKIARTIGISVDYRRRNHCYETIAQNAQRLQEYKNKLILFKKGDFKDDVKTNDGQKINKVRQPPAVLKVRRITAKDKKFEAFVTLRRARNDGKHAGKRLKKKMSKTEGIEGGKILIN